MIVVVGKGIFGLSVAEFLSRQRQNKIVVLASDEHVPASRAAAANLSTKSQVFARDPHFELKISGKKNYPEWLKSLCYESAGFSLGELKSSFVSSRGRDLFSSVELADRQWNRVVQPKSEISARGLPEQSVVRVGSQEIEYGDEAWVDASFLLNLLESVCRSRGVEFRNCDIADLANLEAECVDAQSLILCTGSQTPRILQAWNLSELPPSLGKSQRWSYGGTLAIDIPGWQMPDGISLLEYVSAEALEKVTFSGTYGKLYCSSVSVSCADKHHQNQPAEPDFFKIEAQQRSLISTLHKIFKIKLDLHEHHWRWGVRLGYGHRELVVEALPHTFSFLKGPLVVAAGAHKSGFLFAPEIGSLVGQKLQA